MFLEFVAMKKDSSFIQFSIDIETGRIGTVAYEYYPQCEYGVPIRFDRVALLNIIQSDDYELYPQQSNHILTDRFIKKSLSLLLKAH